MVNHVKYIKRAWREKATENRLALTSALLFCCTTAIKGTAGFSLPQIYCERYIFVIRKAANPAFS